MIRFAVIAVALAGCRLEAKAPDGAELDAGDPVADAMPAPIDAGDTSGQWSVPVRVTSIEDSGRELADPLYVDGVLYWAQTPAGGDEDIMSARFDLVTLEATGIEPVSELNSADPESTPWVSVDRLLVAFQRFEPNRIVGSIREEVGEPWPLPQESVFEIVNQEPGVLFGSISGDRLTLAYSRGEPADIYISRRDNTSQNFPPGVIEPNLSTTADELGPRLTSDGARVTFARGSVSEPGSFDVYEASFGGDQFDEATRVDDLSDDDSDDADLWIADDGSFAFFTRVTADGRRVFFSRFEPGA